MEENFYQAAVDLAREYGWDAKTWHRKTGIYQRSLEQIMDNQAVAKEAALTEILKRTKTSKNVDISNMFLTEKPIVLCSHNHKGGVGKTTIAVTLAEELVRRRYNVLVIDTDVQHNATSYLLKEQATEMLPGYFHQLLTDGVNPYDIIISGHGSAPDVIASYAGAETLEYHLYKMQEQQESRLALADALSPVLNDPYYDFIIIDTPSQGVMLNQMVLACSTHCYCPVEACVYSEEAVDVTYNEIENLNQLPGVNVRFLGPVLNRVAFNQSISEVVPKDLEDAFPGLQFKTIIRSSSAFSKATYQYKSLRDYRSSRAAKDISDFADEVIDRLKAEQKEGV